MFHIKFEEICCYGVSPHRKYLNNVDKMLLFSNNLVAHKELLKKNDIIIFMPELAAKYFFAGKNYKLYKAETDLKKIIIISCIWIMKMMF